MHLTMQCCNGPVEFGKTRPRKSAFDRTCGRPERSRSASSLSGGMAASDMCPPSLGTATHSVRPDETGNANARARPEHQLGSAGRGLATAYLMKLAAAQMGEREGERLEIV